MIGWCSGILARQRKQELEVINSQLRQINISLRRQARVESYAPGLSYAPVGGPAPLEERVATRSAPRKTDGAKEEVMRRLKEGKLSHTFHHIPHTYRH